MNESPRETSCPVVDGRFPRASLWALLLAAGDGARLRSVPAIGEDNRDIPKQYRRFGGRESMLRWTIERAGRLVPKQRIVTVVARDHESWWTGEVDDLEPDNVVVQPVNKGTAAGVLLPLLRVLSVEPRALVVLLPCDHFVGDESLLEETLRRAIDTAATRTDAVVLVGMESRSETEDYGWIVPGPPIDGSSALTVQRFVEKPDAEIVENLISGGALVNSLMLAARAEPLARLICTAVPELATAFSRRPALEPDDGIRIRAVYRELGSHDFSREVLERAVERLLVHPAPAACGWSDLGTPSRLSRYLERRTAIGA